MTQVQQASYDAVTKAFDDFCKPKTNPVYERFVFSQRMQKEGETFDSFHVDIKRLVKNCEFGDRMDEMLRDRIVIGVLNKQLQKKLLSIAGLTYDATVQECKSNEATQGQADEMNKTTATVSEVKKGSSNSNNTQTKKTWQKKQPFDFIFFSFRQFFFLHFQVFFQCQSRFLRKIILIFYF